MLVLRCVLSEIVVSISDSFQSWKRCLLYTSGGATVGKVEDAASDGAKVISWIGDHHCVAPAGAGKVRPFGMIWLGNEQVH